ncbi:MAG: helix-turn-helix domain-containing protein [Candidatus Bathyarchaeia archaeon]
MGKAQETDPIELLFTVYGDGIVEVDYFVEVDPTEPSVNVSLFGANYQNILVLDQDGGPLDYQAYNGGITIDSLGSIELEVSYLTPELTSKEGGFWSFSVYTPISSRITLPQVATIEDLNSLPLAIGTIEGYPYVTMPSGEVRVDYTLSVPGTEEDAREKIEEARNIVEEAKGRGIILDEAEELLQQASDAFDQRLFTQAEQLAEDAKERALETIDNAEDASEAMSQASSSIEAADEAGRTEGLDNAEALLEDAQEAYSSGSYQLARNLANQANIAAVEAGYPDDSNQILYAGAVVSIIVASILLAWIYLKHRSKPGQVKRYDVKAVFVDNPNLRLDDREVVRYLADRGGELFATEIRERFDIPRTSAWRLIRRLEDAGIVSESKVGGQSLVRLRDKYLEED